MRADARPVCKSRLRNAATRGTHGEALACNKEQPCRRADDDRRYASAQMARESSMFQYTQSASGRSYMHPVVTDRRCGNAATATANVEYILRAWSLDTHHHMTWKVKGAAKLKTCHAISAIFNYTSLQQKSETKHGILSHNNSIIMARALEKS